MSGGSNQLSKFADRVADKFVDRMATLAVIILFTVLAGIGTIAYSFLAVQPQIGIVSFVLVLSMVGNVFALVGIRMKRNFQPFKGMNIFLLCCDMRYAINALNELPKDNIMLGLRKTHHHIKEAGLPDELVDKAWKLIVEAGDVGDWGDKEHRHINREIFVNRVSGLYDEVAKELHRRQPDYKGYPG